MSTPSNLTQPVSLVKYGNAVMVSTSGKKNIKDSICVRNSRNQTRRFGLTRKVG
jgi:hypothetical protein